MDDVLIYFYLYLYLYFYYNPSKASKDAASLPLISNIFILVQASNNCRRDVLAVQIHPCLLFAQICIDNCQF
jgi:hypothetical protein